MKDNLASLITINQQGETVYRPVLYRLHLKSDLDRFQQLLQDDHTIRVFDQLDAQIGELIKSKHPKKKFDKKQLARAIEDHIGEIPHEEYGVWVYYPWSSRLVHILDENEFIEVRTNRNQYKITHQERDTLSAQKIGIIGLSVGQSVAMTMAMERCFGEIRLADHDVLELSNLNRIRTGLHNLGIPKVISVAREIAETDPFLKVKCQLKGINEDNIDQFLLDKGKLDILIDECDSIDIKLLCRQKARANGIPVVMEASDRGCIDIERYDLDPQLPIFHGLLEHLDTSRMKGLSNEEKIPYLISIHPPDSLSKRIKASMMEVEETITTWPQLASSVTLGGALATDVCRRILLNDFQGSGRYFVDLEEIIADPFAEEKSLDRPEMPEIAPITLPEMKKWFSGLKRYTHTDLAMPGEKVVAQIVEAAISAPTGGNSQPWKWMYSEGTLALFLEKSRSTSFMDYRSLSSYIGLGAAIENLVLKAHQLSCEVKPELMPLDNDAPLVAAVHFMRNDIGPEMKERHEYDALADMLDKRCTNRIIQQREPLEEDKLLALEQLVKQDKGADLQLVSNMGEIEALAEIIGRAERLRLLHPKSHEDFFVRELRWSTEQSLATNDGVDLMTMNLSDSDIAGLQIAKDPAVMDLLRKWGLGEGLRKVRRKTVLAASAMGLITLPVNDQTDYLRGGRLMERCWLAAQELGISFQPLYVPLTLFERLNHQNNDLPEEFIAETENMRTDFLKIFPNDGQRREIMLFRLCIANSPKVRSLRRPVEEVLFFS